MNAHLALVLAVCLLAGCATPTLAQRQEAWRQHQRVQQLTCRTGLTVDPAMPADVREWCGRVAE